MNYEEFLIQLMAKDDRYLAVTAENRAPMRNLPARFPDRFLDVGIAEQTMIGMAAGLALRGRIPIVHALASFLTMRSFEFIRTDIGLGNLPVKLVGALAGFLSEANGPTHQALEDIALMRGIPRMNVFCPADEADMLAGLPRVLSSSAPFYIRYNDLKPQTEHVPYEIGKAEVFGDGRDVAILCYGFLFHQALAAKEALAGKGLGVRLVNLRTLKPIDEEALVAAARDCKLVVTVEDHFLSGGLYTMLAEVLLRHRITARVLPFALEEKWFKPAPLHDALEYEGFTGGRMAERIGRGLEAGE